MFNRSQPPTTATNIRTTNMCTTNICTTNICTTNICTTSTVNNIGSNSFVTCNYPHAVIVVHFGSRAELGH
ncbi:hypothetical protein ACLKA7_005759 [Drosophila subpalustris]